MSRVILDKKVRETPACRDNEVTARGVRLHGANTEHEYVVSAT